MSTRTGRETGRQVSGVPLGVDGGLLIVRVAVGLLFIGHGLGKLFGWFGQGGVDGTGQFFESVGYKPGETLAVVAGITELGAGILLVIGLLVPLAAAAIIGDMLNASWVKSEDGFWVADNGYEYELVLIVLAVALAVTGAGAYAVDGEREWFRNRTAGVAVAVGLGVISGAILMFIRE